MKLLFYLIKKKNQHKFFKKKNQKVFRYIIYHRKKI
jgi:hypothetical protein